MVYSSLVKFEVFEEKSLLLMGSFFEWMIKLHLCMSLAWRYLYFIIRRLI